MDKENTTHPGFGYGVKGLVIYVPEARIDELAEAFAAVLDKPNLAEEEHLGIFQVERLVAVEGATPFVEITIQTPEEEWQVKAVEEYGMLLGDMVVGGISMLATPGLMHRIDVDESVASAVEERGVGRIFRDLDLPPGVTVPGAEDAENL
jgi:hypothetical protein